MVPTPTSMTMATMVEDFCKKILKDRDTPECGLEEHGYMEQNDGYEDV
jgi:hypothetical protein